MSFFKANKLGFLAAGVTVIALFAAQGCGGDDDSQAGPSAGAAGKSGSGTGESGAPNNNGGSGNTGNTEAGTGGVDNNEAGAAGAAGAPVVDPGCVDATGCYTCEPKTSIQFLNACVEGGCPAHFDNGTLTKIDLVGTL